MPNPQLPHREALHGSSLSRVVVVMPAYNAAATLARTYRDLPSAIVNHVILVDDGSTDETAMLAGELGIEVIRHPRNRGYGANQKTCYRAALAAGAEIVVMVHPDWQYDPTKLPALIAPITAGEADMVLGSRFLGDPLAGGMPWWKFLANRGLTALENHTFGLNLSEYHTGFRAYSRRLLETIDLEANSDDFVFDQQVVARVAAAGLRIAEIAVPTRYLPDSSSVNFRRSVVYGAATLVTIARFRVGVYGRPPRRQVGAATLMD